jgi:hypothetical protein
LGFAAGDEESAKRGWNCCVAICIDQPEIQAQLLSAHFKSLEGLTRSFLLSFIPENSNEVLAYWMVLLNGFEEGANWNGVL